MFVSKMSNFGGFGPKNPPKKTCASGMAAEVGLDEAGARDGVADVAYGSSVELLDEGREKY